MLRNWCDICTFDFENSDVVFWRPIRSCIIVEIRINIVDIKKFHEKELLPTIRNHVFINKESRKLALGQLLYVMPSTMTQELFIVKKHVGIEYILCINMEFHVGRQVAANKYFCIRNGNMTFPIVFERVSWSKPALPRFVFIVIFPTAISTWPFPIASSTWPLFRWNELI